MKCWPGARDDKTVLLEKIAWLGIRLCRGRQRERWPRCLILFPSMFNKMHFQLFAVSAKLSNTDVSFLRKTSCSSRYLAPLGILRDCKLGEGLITVKFFPCPEFNLFSVPVFPCYLPCVL